MATKQTSVEITRHDDRGFTLLEVLVASVLVLVLGYLVMTLSKTGIEAQDYARRMGRVTELTQELVENIREEVQSSIRVFSNGTIGNGYVAAFDLAAFSAPIGTTRLPVLDEDGVFEPETAAGTETGNSMCVARHAWSDEFATSIGNTYRIDIYRFVYYYLTAVDGGPVSGSAGGLNLVQWVSEPLADGNQIDNILNAPDKAEVLEHLRVASADTSGGTHTKVELVWKVGENLATVDTLRHITSGGVLSSAPRVGANWSIKADTTRSATDMLHYRHHAIASNFAPKVAGVARFGFKSNTGDGFPHGFEVQAIGPSSARQVLLHVSVVSTRSGRLASHQAQIITDARDL